MYNTENDTVSMVKCHLWTAEQNKNKSAAMHNGLMVKHIASISQFSKHPVTEKWRQQITDLVVRVVMKDNRTVSALSGQFLEFGFYFDESSFCFYCISFKKKGFI